MINHFLHNTTAVRAFLRRTQLAYSRCVGVYVGDRSRRGPTSYERLQRNEEINTVSSRNRTRRLRCIVLNEHITVFAGSGPPYATGVSLGPPVVNANGISIASAFFAGLTKWQTDWQTTLLGP